MQMHQIRYYLALCDEQNFTRAAQRCGVSQPSLTRAIKLLEEELGSSLYDRANNRMTDIGNILRSDFSLIDRTAAEIKRKAAKKLPHARLDINREQVRGYENT
ncbi:MAG: LysR family transcriptional regulator [Pseudolabrys sp.]|nr:LysR family transcriptional regulator [Pseudolabrys sp.]